MTRSSPGELYPFDPEIERTFRRQLREHKELIQNKSVGEKKGTNNMEDENDNAGAAGRTMGDLSRPSLNGAESSITRPRIEANNFEIKPQMIHMLQQFVQFDGLPEEDPNAHIANFLEICDTFKFNGVSEDAIRLRLFPFSLRDKAKGWLKTNPPGSITTWNQLAEKFLTRYFPPSRLAKLRNDIISFQQMENETLYEAWERWKEMLRKCPHHGFDLGMQMQTFHSGLNFSTKQLIDASSGGTTSFKTPAQLQELIENIAMNNYQWGNTRQRTRPTGVHNVDAMVSLEAKVEALTKKLEAMTIPHKLAPASVLMCDFCGGGHPNHECQSSTPSDFSEHVEYVGTQSRGNPYSNTYNPGWRNHPNFSWSNQQQQQKAAGPPGFQHHGQQQTFQQNYPQQAPKPNLEEILGKFIATTENRFQSSETSLRNQEASIRNLETQVGQIARLLSERQPGTLPSNTETNPRAESHAITLRSGKELPPVLKEQTPKEKEPEQVTKKDDDSPRKQEVAEYKPKIPYPSRLEKEKKEEQFGKFLELFKQLHINIPFVEALSQMPKYAKFLKDLLSNKKKLEELSMVTLNEECSAIVQNKLPQKVKDPGRFTIPCIIGSLSISGALADLGASINLMPYTIFQKLGLGEPKATRMSLQLADRSIKYPRGIIEDVLVKVDKFIFPVDFVILDMEEDVEIPLILGRPFLATGKALIDVHDGKLTLRVEDEKAEFNIPKAMKHSLDNDDSCFSVDMIDTEVVYSLQEFSCEDPLEVCIAKGNSEENFNPLLLEQVAYLDATEEMVRKKAPENIERPIGSKLKPSIKEPPESS